MPLRPAVEIEPVSSPEFPANREINREFRQIRLLGAILHADTRANAKACSEIPYSTKHFREGTGNLHARTENLNQLWCGAIPDDVFGRDQVSDGYARVAPNFSRKMRAPMGATSNAL
ncbi:MAG: hypothetical protein WCF55_24050, partial [Pseudolabrys sp.]